MAEETVPKATVKALADNIRRKFELDAEKERTMALLIRGVLRALNQTTDQAQRKLERTQRHVYMHEPARKVRMDREAALRALAQLADMLEKNSKASGTLTLSNEGK